MTFAHGNQSRGPAVQIMAVIHDSLPAVAQVIEWVEIGRFGAECHLLQSDTVLQDLPKYPTTKSPLFGEGSRSPLVAAQNRYYYLLFLSNSKSFLGKKRFCAEVPAVWVGVLPSWPLCARLRRQKNRTAPKCLTGLSRTLTIWRFCRVLWEYVYGCDSATDKCRVC